MQTTFLCLYAIRGGGFQIYVGLKGFRWWGLEWTRKGVRRLYYECVA
jgi:hypothetical protein